MRYMVMHKVDADMEAGKLPRPGLIEEMGAFIQEAIQSGVLKNGAGLRPSRTRTRLTFTAGKVTRTDGPYSGGNELVASVAMLEVKTKEEAFDWAARYAQAVGDCELELGPTTEEWDLGLCEKPADAPLHYLLLHKADRASESGAKPSAKTKAELARLAAEMSRAGVLMAAEGLQPSSKATRLRFKAGQRTVLDGPFAESKELIAGFAILELPDLSTVIDMATRYARILGPEVEVDVRPLEESSLLAT